MAGRPSAYHFNFCRVCGAKSKDEWMGFYSPETGEKIMRSVCSENRCHTGHDEQRIKGFQWFWEPDWKCSRCDATGIWFYGL